MVTRKIHPKSLKNLSQANKEINQLTKESIETALLFLLEKKDLKHISISELVQKAGVSRNAFYRNYKSKEEILEAYYERTSEQWKKKWQQMHTRVQKEGISQSFANFIQQQRSNVEKNQTLINVSQWIKEKTRRE